MDPLTNCNLLKISVHRCFVSLPCHCTCTNELATSYAVRENGQICKGLLYSFVCISVVENLLD